MKKKVRKRKNPDEKKTLETHIEIMIQGLYQRALRQLKHLSYEELRELEDHLREAQKIFYLADNKVVIETRRY